MSTSTPIRENTFDNKLIMLTGATGYVGGRLLKMLEQRGYRVRCMARSPEILIPRVASSTEVVEGDVLDLNSLKVALKGVSVAYYLVHSMSSEGSFEEKDRKAAHNFGKIAKAAGYLLSNKTQKKNRVIISKDTRLSGYQYEPLITSGFVSMGIDAILVGPLPTSALPILIRSLRADMGVMITASHNNYKYNGIKFFNSLGEKLSRKDENEIVKVFNSLRNILDDTHENVHRKIFGKSWNGSVDKGEWTKLFNILKHNYLHLPVHAKNQKQKVIDKINNFLEGV